MSLTIACVLVRGHIAFTPDYVAKLYLMCRRYAGRPFRFVCLTDQADGLPPFIEPIEARKPDGLKAWWTKVQLFKPGLFRGRVLYLDLDTLVVAPLRDIIDYPASFALAPDAGTFQGTENLKVVKRYNSSVMIWDAGVNTELYLNWSPAVGKRLWGDQDWVGEQYPVAAPMPLEWFPRISQPREEWSPEAKVVLVKKPKNEEAARRWPWFREAWPGGERV
jgi:hypothetical protein